MKGGRVLTPASGTGQAELPAHAPATLPPGDEGPSRGWGACPGPAQPAVPACLSRTEPHPARCQGTARKPEGGGESGCPFLAPRPVSHTGGGAQPRGPAEAAPSQDPRRPSCPRALLPASQPLAPASSASTARPRVPGHSGRGVLSGMAGLSPRGRVFTSLTPLIPLCPPTPR